MQKSGEHVLEQLEVVKSCIGNFKDLIGKVSDIKTIKEGKQKKKEKFEIV